MNIVDVTGKAVTGITGYIKHCRELFPQDSPTVSRLFGAALHSEDHGDSEKAERMLDKAIAAEESGS